MANKIQTKLDKLNDNADVKDLTQMLRFGGYDDETINQIVFSLLEMYDEKNDQLNIENFQELADNLLPAMIGEKSPVRKWIDATIILDRPEFDDLHFAQDDLFEFREELLSIHAAATEEMGDEAIFDILLNESDPRYLLAIGHTIHKHLPEIVTGDVINAVYKRIHDLYEKTEEPEFKDQLSSALFSFNMLHGKDNPFPIYLLIKSLAREVDWLDTFFRTHDFEPTEKDKLRLEFEDSLFVALNYAEEEMVLMEDDEFDDTDFDPDEDNPF